MYQRLQAYKVTYKTFTVWYETGEDLAICSNRRESGNENGVHN